MKEEQGKMKRGTIREEEKLLEIKTVVADINEEISKKTETVASPTK